MPKCAFGGRHWRQLSCNAMEQPRGGYLASKVTTGEAGIDTHLILFSSSIFSIFWCKNSQIQILVWSNFLLFICLQRKQRCERCRPLLRTHSAIELFSSFYIWQMGRVVFGEGLGRNLMKLLIQRLPRQLLFPPRLNWRRCQIKLQMQSFQILSLCQPSEID